MTNRQWFDTYARHMVDTELYATARAELTLSMLEKLHKELKQIVESYGTIRSKKEEQKCADECNECIERYISEWKDKEDNERREHANNEAEWLSRMIKAALGISLINSLLKTNRALETPFSSSDTFESFVDEMKSNVQKAVRTPLLSSRIFGSSTSSVSESMDSAFKRIENNAKANMQSSVTGLQRNVQYQLIGDNRKLKFVYVSMLDDSTCVVCGGYSGTVYEDISEAPAVPVHIRCRCFYMPVLSSNDDVSDITGETYEDWFKRQLDSVKYKILGPTRYGLYKSGVTDIKSFSGGGRKLTLKELFSGEVEERNPILDKSKMWFKEKVTKDCNLYIAQGRLEAGMKDPLVYGSDKLMAKVLARETGKDVYLLPEINKGNSNPDGFFNGDTIEFKNVRGSQRKVGSNAVSALQQAKNVFVYVEKNFDIKTCTEKINGSYYDTKQNYLKKNIPFSEADLEANLYIYTNNTLYTFKWSDVL